MTATTRGRARSLVRLATRGSPLARWQAERVASLLAAADPSVVCEVVVVRTLGDDRPDVALHRLGGRGVFVKEVQGALLDGRADVAVHSAKDLPAATPDGLVLACVPERGDPRDAMVGSTLADLATGAVVATGSVRRRAQLAWLRPDVTFCELRGNLARRVERALEVGAGVVAFAALVRLGLEAHAAEVLAPGVMLPQVGQGALALECRADDGPVRGLLAAVDDPTAHRAVIAERAFLGALGGGCTVPVGALATVAAAPSPGATPPHPGSEIHLEAMIAGRDGHVLLRRRAVGVDPSSLGRALAVELLDEAGGRALVDWVSVPPASSLPTAPTRRP